MKTVRESGSRRMEGSGLENVAMQLAHRPSVTTHSFYPWAACETCCALLNRLINRKKERKTRCVFESGRPVVYGSLEYVPL